MTIKIMRLTSLKITLSILLILPFPFSVLAAENENQPADRLALVEIEKGEIINVCGESGVEWYPYEVERMVDGQPEIEGYTIDVLKELLSRYELNYNIVSRPWQRCMYEVEENERQIATATSLSADRESKFLMTNAIYSLTPSYFYMKEKYPNGLNVENGEQLLSTGRVCGRIDYHYQNFGMAESNIKKEANTFQALVGMTRLNRCDIFIARVEVLAGYSALGESILTDDIGYAAIPGTKPDTFHFAISKKYPYADELLKIMNEGIESLENQGVLQALLKKYGVVTNVEQTKI